MNTHGPSYPRIKIGSNATNAMPPLISVCIPTYRGAAHLPAAIDSVLEQTLSDFELVIIDDNSPDQTAEIVSAYSDSRIRYLRNSVNLGPEGNWNRCLAEARGTYFKLLPQDDLLYPQSLARQAAVLDADTDSHIALVFGARDIVDCAGRIITRRGYPHGRNGALAAHELIRRCVRHGTNLIGEPGGVLFRKATADSVGYFDGSIPYVIDLDYWVRLLSYGEGYYLSDPVSAFRVASSSWSVAIGNSQSTEYSRFIAKVQGISGIEITLLDSLVGKLLAHVNNILRLIFYKLFLSREC
jgi:glycosyltransferase involved in cell wall biosynthesis